MTKVRLGAVPSVRVYIPMRSLMLVFRSSQYAMMTSLRVAVGMQTFAPDTELETNCKVPLLEALTWV